MEKQATAGFWVSPQQERVWLLQESAPLAYRSLYSLHLDGELNCDALKQAVQEAVARHEILRTVFHHQSGVRVPFQVIRESCGPSWHDNDLSHLDPSMQEAELLRLFETDRLEPFDLTAGPLLHARLAKLAADRHVLFLSAPALNSDQSTLKNLVPEIQRIYAARLGQGEISDELLQYADVAQWQEELLQSEDTRAGRNYWRDQIRKLDLAAIPNLSLPAEHRPDSNDLFAPEVVPVLLPPQILPNISELSTKAGVSVSDFLLACWQALLCRITLQGEITIGYAFDGRRYEELQEALGPLTRYLPLKLAFDPQRTILETSFLSGQAAREAATWQECLTWTQLETAGGFEQGMLSLPFCFDYTEWPALATSADLGFTLMRQWVCTEKYKLKLVGMQAEGKLQLELHYDASRYLRSTIESFADSFRVLLRAALENPSTAVSRLPLLSEAERQRVLVDWNQTSAAYSQSQTIHSLFEQQVQRTPERLALVCQDESLTYAELNRQANRLGHHLRHLGVGPDVLVGICLERSAQWIVALLAVLKAGGAYVPLSPDNPAARLAQPLSACHVLLSETKLLSQMPASFSGTTLCLDRDQASWAQQPDSNPQAQTGPDHLVYVIYTSGSTGVPKGVAVRQRNLVNYAEFIVGRLQLQHYPDGLSFGLVSTLAADLGNTCLYPALISGGCLHLVPYEVATDSRRLLQYQQRYPLDVLKIVPSHLSALLHADDGARLLPRKFLVLGGEALSWMLVDKIRHSGATCEILNHYGPTETTVGSLTLRLSECPTLNAQHSATVPIGRPIANTRIYLLDAQLQPVPTGVVGELYVGGAGVTAGYLNQQEKTAERFLPDPFVQTPHARMYRTGDLARYLPDGNVEFLGRGDDQVKVRGFRIELGEVEAAFSAQPGVKQVAVLARSDDASGEKRLVAYLVLSRDHPPTLDTLRHHLHQQLPDYMVPSALVVLDKLPLNANGKVDRNALPSPDAANQALARPYVAPRTPIEEVLASIWAEVLRQPAVSVEDNFFHLGGHSLLATQVVSRVREQFEVDLDLRSLFEAPTVAGLAALVESAQADSVAEPESTISRASRDEYRVSRTNS